MEPFIGEIRVFGCSFAPKGWALCNGQLLPISRYTALFSLLGVNYGGDGKTTFALPNLQGQVAIGAGQGPGLQPYDIGEQGGESGVQLISTEMPAHNHTINGGTAAAPISTLTNAPTSGQSYISNIIAKSGATTGVPGRCYVPAASAVNAALNPACISPTGGSQAHSNMQPFLVTNYCIALDGIFPQRP